MALALFAALGLALAGCATQHERTVLDGGSVRAAQGEPLDDAFGDFLSRSPAGAATHLTASPWGSGVDVVADERYHAASGRECRQLQISGGGGGHTQRAVACRAAGGWETRRLVTAPSATSPPETGRVR